MKPTLLLAQAAAIGLMTAASLTPAMAQPMPTGLYAFHSRAMGKCPGLDWHVMVAPNGALSGFVAWDNMQHMARLTGMMNKDHTFQIDAKGDSGKTAVVKGSATGDYLTASITGSGTACDDQVLQVPRAPGGLEGGGG
jgi:hypothetical protein